MISEINSDDTEILEDQAVLDKVPPVEETNKEVPIPDKIDNEAKPKKGQLVVHSFQLAQNRKPACRFG